MHRTLKIFHAWMWLVLAGGAISVSLKIFFPSSPVTPFAQPVSILLTMPGAFLTAVAMAFRVPGGRIAFPLSVIGFASVLMILEFAVLELSLGLMDGDRKVNDLPSAIYFSVVTWTTLGYGDIRPIGYARLCASIEALTGYVFLGLFLTIMVRGLIGEGSSRALSTPPQEPSPESGMAGHDRPERATTHDS